MFTRYSLEIHGRFMRDSLEIQSGFNGDSHLPHLTTARGEALGAAWAGRERRVREVPREALREVLLEAVTGGCVTGGCVAGAGA